MTDTRNESSNRRAAARLGALLAGVATLALASAGAALAQQKPPIKIGVLLPTSGGFAANGQEVLVGMQIFLDSVKSEVAGRKIELVVEDTQGRPDVGLTKAQKLVERDHVQMLAGLINSAVALAVNTYSRDKKVPLIINGDAGANELTMPGPLANHYLVRYSQNGRTPSAAAADFMWKKGFKKVAAITTDYAGGFDTIGGFANAFCRLGGTIVQEQYPPIGANDYGPYITNVDRSADAVVTFLAGGGGLRFAKQYEEAGLHGKMPLMDIYGQVVYEPNLAQLGETASGIYSTLHYTPLIKSPENDAFVKEYVARVKHLPSDNGPDGWVGAKAIYEAAKALDGNIEDTDKFLDALKAVKFPSAKGPISVDKYGQVIQSMYVREAKKEGADYVNAPVATYDNIDQFWPLTFEEFEAYKYRYIDLKGSLTNCAKVLEKK